MNKKTIFFICFVIYGAAYFYLWMLLLSFRDFAVLKPWATAWILSALISTAIGYFKRQRPFFSFFCGSIFGPLGILMVFFSEKDIRVLNESEKTVVFYDEIFEKLAKIYQKIKSNHQERLLYDMTVDRLMYYASYLNIQLNIKAAGSDENFFFPKQELLKALKEVLIGFETEYRNRFGKDCPALTEMITKVSQDI